jgi:hypothetical protein
MTTDIAEETAQSASSEAPEMLIKEARDIQDRHRRQRWAIALAVLVIVVAVLAVAAGGSRTPLPKAIVNSSGPSRSGPIGSNYALIRIRSQVPQLVVRAGTSNVLYVLYSATCGGKPCYRLTRSANGGQTFTEVTTPPIREYTKGNPLNGSLNQLVFANAEDGYATENFWGKRSTLYATFDGGKSWHREHIKGAQFLQALTTSPTDFYVITEHCDPRHITCTDLRIARTPLRSSAWTSTPVPENVVRGGTPSVGVQIAAYGTKFWILEQSKNPPQRLATSTNGGRSFSISPEAELTGAATCQLTATSMTSLWANCAQGSQDSQVSYSADGGYHWTPSSTEVALRSDKSTDGVRRLLAFGSFDPVAGDVAYATDGIETTPGQPIYQLAASRSGAFRVVGSLPTSNYFYFLTFTNSKQGLAYAFVGQGAKNPLWSTENGGQSWRRVPVPTK